MNEKRIQSLINALAKILTDLGFGDTFLISTKDHGSNAGGIWTGLGEQGVCDYWQDPSHELLDPQIRAWLDRENLFLEWNDPGVVCIWSS